MNTRHYKHDEPSRLLQGLIAIAELEDEDSEKESIQHQCGREQFRCPSCKACDKMDAACNRWLKAHGLHAGEGFAMYRGRQHDLI